MRRVETRGRRARLTGWRWPLIAGLLLALAMAGCGKPAEFKGTPYSKEIS